MLFLWHPPITLQQIHRVRHLLQLRLLQQQGDPSRADDQAVVRHQDASAAAPALGRVSPGGEGSAATHGGARQQRRLRQEEGEDEGRRRGAEEGERSYRGEEVGFPKKNIY